MTQSELTPLTEPRTCGAPSQSCCASAVSEWWSPKQRNPLDSKEAGIDRVFLPPEDTRAACWLRFACTLRPAPAQHGR